MCCTRGMLSPMCEQSEQGRASLGLASSIILPEGFSYSTSFPSVTVDCVPSLALNAGALLRALRKKHPSPWH